MCSSLYRTLPKFLYNTSTFVLSFNLDLFALFLA
jgi:hypothetical protein